MTDSITDIQVHAGMNTIKIEWNILVQNHQYLWLKDELVVRLFCPPELRLGKLDLSSYLVSSQMSESETRSGEFGASLLGVVSASSGVNKAYETSHPIVRDYGLAQERDSETSHYGFVIAMTKIAPPIHDGKHQFTFTWEILGSQDIPHEFNIKVEFGYLINGVFQAEYAPTRAISIPVANQDMIRQRLEHVLGAIDARLSATIYALDSIFLELEMVEKHGAVVQSQLFKPYLVDIEPLTTTSEETPTTFDEVFEKYNHRLLLLGNAGAGKSTALTVFAKHLIEKRLENSTAKIPIYTPITNWRGEKPIRAWIVQETQLPTAVQQEIDNGHAIFLLDGLDEIPSHIGQRDTSPNDPHDYQIEFLEKLREELFGNDVVLTCRDTIYKNLQSRN